MSLPHQDVIHGSDTTDLHEVERLIADTSARILELQALRDAAVLNARARGVTFQRLGDLLGYSRPGAMYLVRRLQDATADVA